jgi:STE24 endopeptidase
MPIDPQRQEKAKEYARIGHRVFALDLVLSALALVVVLVSGLSVLLRDFAASISPDPWISTAFYFAAGFVGYGVLFAPLTYYSSYTLPHRYGLSTQNFSAWLWDAAKGAGLGIVIGGLVIEVIYFVLRTVPAWWWLVAAGFMLLFNVLLANLAPVLIFPIFFKFKPLEDQELVTRLVSLAERAHTRVRGVYTMMLSEKTTAANAAFMGLGNTKRIVLGDTLYKNYSHDEIESVLAHELGHQVHNDIVWGIAIETVLTVFGFLVSDWVLRVGAALFHFEGIADLAAMPLFALALGAFGLVTMPLSNGYSRWRESRADEYALESTRNAGAFVGAMEKLANQNLAELIPEPWVEFLMYDHPPIGKRLRMGEHFRS